MRTILGTAILFLVVFLILVMIGSNGIPRPSGPQAMEFALQWTIRFFGALTAIVSAVGLLLIAAVKGPLERQVTLVLPLLAGLLLLNTTWSLGIAVGAVAVAWLLKRAAPSSNT